SAGQKRVPTEFLRQYSIPLPPLHEQQKITAVLTAVDDKLDVISRQIAATKTLRQGLLQTLLSRGVGTQDTAGFWQPHTSFKTGVHGAIPACWDEVSLGTIAPIVRRPVEISPDAIYPELGLRSYGKGTFHKRGLLGNEVGNKRLFEIKAGDLLFSNVFAWEGAVAIAKPQDVAASALIGTSHASLMIPVQIRRSFSVFNYPGGHKSSDTSITRWRR
ncbi:hypothetical protein G3435_25120, partial [Pseudomonas sp. MAFF212428]|nr:hypothetical protein [Pseudomonas brassicae]